MCLEPVSEYASFGGSEKVQTDSNGMLYNYYLSLTYLKLHTKLIIQ